jgi:hypothetical protein
MKQLLRARLDGGGGRSGVIGHARWAADNPTVTEAAQQTDTITNRIQPIGLPVTGSLEGTCLA